jgi:hypothetical protein
MPVVMRPIRTRWSVFRRRSPVCRPRPPGRRQAGLICERLRHPGGRGRTAFLELLLADEVARRESRSAMLRARTAGLDPTMRLDTWDEPDNLTYDRTLLSDLTQPQIHRGRPRHPHPWTRRCRQDPPGHRAGPYRDPPPPSVCFARAEKLFARLRAARLDNTLEAELRKLARVDLLILDDFALRALDPTEINDFYELVVERHRKASTIVTSNREPAE